MISTDTATSISLDAFEKQKGVVAAALADIREIALRLSADASACTIDNALKGLDDDRFRLVVVGEFSNGKSTLINALLGDLVLPASVHPTTAALSIIRGGPSPTFTAHYRDHRSELGLSREEFRALTAPAEPDPNSAQQVAEYEKAVANLRQIARIDIQYPTILLSKGVELVDTPGTNDLDAVREQITYDFIPNADAIIFLLSAKKICSQSEIDFLKDRIISADIQRLFFAINFSDSLKTEIDQARVVEFARKNLRDIVGEPKLYLVCSKDALQHRRGNAHSGPKTPMPFERTGFPELEQAISTFLNRERGAVKLRKPATIGTRIASELITGPLALRKASIGVSIDIVRSRIASLRPQINQAEREKNLVLDGLRSRFANEGELIAGEVRQGLERIALGGVAAVDSHAGDLTGEAILQSVERAIAPLQTRLVETIRTRQESTLQEECTRAQRRIEAAWRDLQASFDHSFAVTTKMDINVHHSAISEKEEGNLILGGSVFAGILMTILHVVFPIVFVVSALTAIGLGAGIKGRRREQALGIARAQIDERLRAGIPDALRKFDAEWTRLTNGVIQAFEVAFGVRTDSLRSQMADLEHSHSVEAVNAQRSTEECEELSIRLTQAVRTLASIL